MAVGRLATHFWWFPWPNTAKHWQHVADIVVMRHLPDGYSFSCFRLVKNGEDTDLGDKKLVSQVNNSYLQSSRTIVTVVLIATSHMILFREPTFVVRTRFPLNSLNQQDASECERISSLKGGLIGMFLSWFAQIDTIFKGGILFLPHWLHL